MGLIDSVEKMSRSTSQKTAKSAFFGENGFCRFFPGKMEAHGARDALNSDRIPLALPRLIYDTYDHTTWQSSSLGQ